MIEIVSKQAIDQRISEMAQEIIRAYKEQSPLFVCLLRGGAPFAAKLMFAISDNNPNFQPELDYMTIKTYGDERVDKPPELIADIQSSTAVAGRPVIILDDVLDKGITAQFVHELFVSRGASRVDLVVLAQKQRKRDSFPSATLYGFETPDTWLTGMGMDNTSIAKEANRWGEYIASA